MLVPVRGCARCDASTKRRAVRRLVGGRRDTSLPLVRAGIPRSPSRIYRRSGQLRHERLVILAACRSQNSVVEDHLKPVVAGNFIEFEGAVGASPRRSGRSPPSAGRGSPPPPVAVAEQGARPFARSPLHVHSLRPFMSNEMNFAERVSATECRKHGDGPFRLTRPPIVRIPSHHLTVLSAPAVGRGTANW